MDYQQQSNEELHQMTLDALQSARLGTAKDDQLRLLAWHAGIDYDKEVKRAQSTRNA